MAADRAGGFLPGNPVDHVAELDLTGMAQPNPGLPKARGFFYSNRGLIK
jgi:hypothetical protein